MSTEKETLQASGEHPAPCARHCEAVAFEIEIRRLTAERDAMAARLAELEGQTDNLLATCHRLALELECLLLDTKDSAPVSRWWDSAMAALDGWHKAKDAASARAVPSDPVNAQLLSALKGMIAICDEPAGFEGKYGQGLTKALEQMQQKIDARLMAARAAIAAAEARQAEPVRLTDEEIAKTCKTMLVVGYCGRFLEDDGSLLAKKIEAMTLRANGFKVEG